MQASISSGYFVTTLEIVKFITADRGDVFSLANVTGVLKIRTPPIKRARDRDACRCLQQIPCTTYRELLHPPEEARIYEPGSDRNRRGDDYAKSSRPLVLARIITSPQICIEIN